MLFSSLHLCIFSVVRCISFILKLMSDSEEEYDPTASKPVVEVPPTPAVPAPVQARPIAAAAIPTRGDMMMLGVECRGVITCTSLSPSLLAAGSHSGYLSLWNFEEAKREPTVNVVPFPSEDKDHPPITSVAAAPCGTYVVVAQGGAVFRTVKLDETLGRPTPQGEATFLDPTKCKGHKAMVTCLGYLPQSNCVLSGSRDSTVRTWDPERLQFGPTNSYIHGTGLHGADVYCLSAMSRTCFVSGGSDNVVRLWDAREKFTIGKCALSFVLPVSETVGGVVATEASVVARCQSGNVYDVTLRMPNTAQMLCKGKPNPHDVLPIGYRHRTKQLWVPTPTGMESHIKVGGGWVEGKPIELKCPVTSISVSDTGVVMGTEGRVVVASDNASPVLTKWMTAVEMEPRSKTGRKIE